MSDTFDAEGFADLWRTQEARMAARVRRFRVPPDDVDDLLADTRLRMLRAGRNFDNAYALLLEADATARRIVLDRRAAGRRRRRVVTRNAGTFRGVRPYGASDGEAADYLEMVETTAGVRTVLAGADAELNRRGRRAVALLMRGPKYTAGERWVLRNAQADEGWARLRDALSTLLAGAFVLGARLRRARVVGAQPVAATVLAAAAVTAVAVGGFVPWPGHNRAEAVVTEIDRQGGEHHGEPSAFSRPMPAAAANVGSPQAETGGVGGPAPGGKPPVAASTRAALPTGTSAGAVSVNVTRDETTGNGHADAGLIVRCDNSELRRPLCTATGVVASVLPTVP